VLRQRPARYSVTDPETGCLLWVASRATNGYGLMRWQRRLWLAPSRRLDGEARPYPAGADNSL
jgi:hypothetical protein